MMEAPIANIFKIEINKEKYLNEFETKINNLPNKDKLLNILCSRLEGSLKIDYLPLHDSKTFDFEKYLNDENKYYLEDFDKYYFTNPLLDENKKKYIAPILLEINEVNNSLLNIINDSSTGFKSLHNSHSNGESFKKIILTITQNTKIKFLLMRCLENILILSKIQMLNELLNHHFYSIIGDTFDIIKMIDKDGKNTFRNLFRNISNHINECYKVFVIIDKDKYNLSKILEFKKVLNGIFWLVYANELKLFDSIEKIFLVTDEQIEMFEKKMYESFIVTDEIETEDGQYHTHKINMLNVFELQLQKLENDIANFVETKIETFDKSMDSDFIITQMTSELNTYIDMLKIEDEYKDLCKEMFCYIIYENVLSRNMDNIMSRINALTTI